MKKLATTPAPDLIQFPQYHSIYFLEIFSSILVAMALTTNTENHQYVVRNGAKSTSIEKAQEIACEQLEKVILESSDPWTPPSNFDEKKHNDRIQTILKLAEVADGKGIRGQRVPAVPVSQHFTTLRLGGTFTHQILQNVATELEIE